MHLTYQDPKGHESADRPALEIILTLRMVCEGLRELHKDRSWENDWEVLARIYAAMRAAEVAAHAWRTQRLHKN